MLLSRRANAHLLVRFNTWTSQKRLLNWNPIPKLTIVLIWKTPACCRKFATKKTLSLSSERSTLSPTELPRVYISAWRNALWLNAMHCGKKWWIREFVSPYIFPLNPDYVAARSLRSLRSNDCKSKRIYVYLNDNSITVSNSSNPSRVHIRLCKHGKRFLLLKDLIKTYNNN